jgi:hypothetical protein
VVAPTTYHRDKARTGYLAGLADPTGLGRAWSAGWTVRVPLVVGDRVLVPMSRIRCTRLSRLDNLVNAAARLSNRNLGSLETRVIPG